MENTLKVIFLSILCGTKSYAELLFDGVIGLLYIVFIALIDWLCCNRPKYVLEHRQREASLEGFIRADSNRIQNPYRAFYKSSVT